MATDIAHAKPSPAGERVKARIVQSVLKSNRVGLLPCGEAIRCMSNLLAALCLSPYSSETIVKRSPLMPYLLILATPFYSLAMHSKIIIRLGSSVDQLMCHVEILRDDGIAAMCKYLNISASFVLTDVSRYDRPARPTPSLLHTGQPLLKLAPADPQLRVEYMAKQIWIRNRLIVHSSIDSHNQNQNNRRIRDPTIRLVETQTLQLLPVDRKQREINHHQT